MSFNLPYVLKGQRNVPDNGVDITQLKKYDTVQLFFGEFDTDPGIIEITNANNPPSGMTKVFDGFIDSIKLAKSKTAISYLIQSLGTLGLANDRHVTWQKKEDVLSALVSTLLEISGLGNLTFESELDAAEEIRAIVDGGTNLKELLMNIRNKYAHIIHQGGDGVIRLFTPFSLTQAATTFAYEFDISLGNVFDIDYGDLTSNINAVVVLGYPNVMGQAVDPIMVQNNNGEINYISFENRNLLSEEDCEQVARNKLLEIARNYSISFRTKFDPRFAVGQAFTLNDNDKYNGTQVFMIKKYAFTIDKQDVSCIVTGYTHALDIVPNDILISPTGVLDVDFLELTEKDTDVGGWNQIPFD